MAADPGPSGASPETSVTAQPDRELAPAWAAPTPAGEVVTGMIHHLEFWVPDLDRAVASWGWLLDELGYKPFGDWPGGRSWRAGHTYIVLEQSPDRTASRHDRHRPGLNHLAFHVADQALLEKLVAVAPSNGWRLMFADRHPHAGGEGHYAAYLENADGFEAELVAPSASPAAGATG
ncbi:MAG TPA: VOC family protein [Streptosporangiaceae bacterium]|nr:VOC family protein [Streptosporangiaceae bacterium]